MAENVAGEGLGPWRNARLGFTSLNEYSRKEDGVEKNKSGRPFRMYCSVAGERVRV